MSTPEVNICSMCHEPLGDIFTNAEGESYVTVTLHQPSQEVAHRVHRLCIFQWFEQQLETEPAGIRVDDFSVLPFTCPECRAPVTLQEADYATGVPMDTSIKISRMAKQLPPMATPGAVNRSFCVLL